MRVGRVTARQSRTGYTRCLQVPCPGPAARHRASPGPRHGFRVTHLARAEDRPHSPLGAPPCRRRPASPARAPATEPRVASPWARACGQASSARRPRGETRRRVTGRFNGVWPRGQPRAETSRGPVARDGPDSGPGVSRAAPRGRAQVPAVARAACRLEKRHPAISRPIPGYPGTSRDSKVVWGYVRIRFL